MKAEILAIGTELLLGQIVNTNAQYLSQQCALLGIDVYFQTVVGDNEQRLRDAFALAKSRADLIICTGGIGPTQDDLTKDVLSSISGMPIILHQPSMDKMTAFFQKRNVPMVESNIRQAHMLDGSDPLLNDTGMAVGLAFTHEGTHYIVLPGPPKEMKPMFDRYATPWIQSKSQGELPLYSKMLKFAGIGESGLEHALIDLIKDQTDPTIAPYAKEGEVTIRLSTKATDPHEAESKMYAVEQEIRKRVGAHIYAEDDISIEDAIVRIMEKMGTSLATAESCTGGLLGDLITNIPGTSVVYRGGIICYTNDIKHRVLGVPKEVLDGPDAPGAVSEQTAILLAENVMNLMGASYGLAITGVAGPNQLEGHPVGLVYVGIAIKGVPTEAVKLQLAGTREMVKLRAAKSALYHLWKRMNRS